MSQLYDLDAGLDFCPCGTITANIHGLCRRCTEDEATDPEFHRSSSHADPYGVRS